LFNATKVNKVSKFGNKYPINTLPFGGAYAEFELSRIGLPKHRTAEASDCRSIGLPKQGYHYYRDKSIFVAY
jgi:hypothetical protein